MKIMVALSTAEMGRRSDFYDYFNQMTKPEGTLLCSSHGQSPSRNKNIMVRQALENDCTHIFFADDDMAFQIDTLTKLVAHEKDMITGLYLMRNYPHYPIIFDEAYTDGRCRFSFLQDGRQGVEEIVNCGLGCVLIKTDVFKEMVVKNLVFHTPEGLPVWFTLGELEKDHWCDDISFFLRARKAGFKLFVDLDTWVGHMVTGTLYPKYENGKWYSTLTTTASTEGIQFAQVTPTPDALKEGIEKLGVIKEEVTV